MQTNTMSNPYAVSEKLISNYYVRNQLFHAYLYYIVFSTIATISDGIKAITSKPYALNTYYVPIQMMQPKHCAQCFLFMRNLN